MGIHDMWRRATRSRYAQILCLTACFSSYGDVCPSMRCVNQFLSPTGVWIALIHLPVNGLPSSTSWCADCPGSALMHSLPSCAILMSVLPCRIHPCPPPIHFDICSCHYLQGFKSSYECVKYVVSHHGIRGVYQGFQGTMIRNLVVWFSSCMCCQHDSASQLCLLLSSSAAMILKTVGTSRWSNEILKRSKEFCFATTFLGSCHPIKIDIKSSKKDIRPLW